MTKRILFVVAAVFGATALMAQTTELAGEELLRALLSEMKSLRTTIQKNAAYEVRANVLLERLRLQQQIVQELQREVDSRNLEASFRMTEEPAEVYEADLEARLRVETDPNQRRMLERELTGMSRRKEDAKRHREAMLVHAQRQERRLVEERDKLAAIEKELEKLQNAIVGE